MEIKDIKSKLTPASWSLAKRNFNYIKMFSTCQFITGIYYF